MLDNLPQVSEATSELAGQIKTVMDMDGLTQAKIAKDAEVSASSLSGLVNGKALTNQAEVEAKLRKWLTTRGEQLSLRETLPELPGFLMTPTAERILNALTFAHAAEAMAIVYGPPGIGKTVSLRQYKASYSNVWLATMTPSSATLVPALKAVVRALGTKGRLPNVGQDLTQQIYEHVADKNGLLIVDEAQHLKMEALEELRSIHDGAGVGLAFAGNEQVYSRLTGNEKGASFAQLSSRIGKRVALRLPAKEDVKAICGAWRLAEREAVKFLTEKSALPGGLRQVNFTLRLAAMFARSEERQIGFEDVKRAWTDLNFENGVARR